MNARRDPSDGPEAASLGGRVLLVGAVVFAAAATGLLVLTDEQKWLRLGIVAALWAALSGAFLAARYRRQVTDQRDVVAERQEIYELELEREIAARREYELEVEAKAKRQAEESSREDLAALRAEMQNLRQTLEGLLGGEFLVERYALRAESTRMRSLGEDRSIAVRHDVKHLPAAQPMVVPQVIREAETELIERIRDTTQKPPRRVADSRPPSAPRRPDRPTPEPAKPAPTPRPEPVTRQQPHPAEVSDRWFVPDGLAGAAPPAPRRAEPPRRQEPQRPAETPQPRAGTWEDGEQEWGPSWEKQPRPGAPVATTAEQADWLAQYNQPPQAAEPGSRVNVPQQEPPRRNGVEDSAVLRFEPPLRPQPPQQPQEEGGGRRRRAEGQPSWQETVGQRTDEAGGSHASGRSVSELLANHGRDASPRRRRRRED
ncbi:DUF6779 domain-containing protein [Actinophytocola sp.]|uniref:DUF6779 domain-containing protein n=1 Tax=Actinophytocola sp. TaxID=1872138 RepID=UPI002ED69695